MLFFYLLIGAAIFVVFLLANLIWSSFFVSKQKSNAKQLTKDRLFNVNEKLDEGKPDFWSDFKAQVIKRFEHMPVLGLTANKKHYLQTLIDTVESEEKRPRTPEEIHFDQLLHLSIYVLACLILSLITKYAVLGLLACYVVYKIPVNKLKNEYEKGLQEIRFQFPSFYDTVYVQYSKRDASVLMSDIVSAYIPIATGAFKRLLKRFLIDLEKGEDQALRELDARYSDSVDIHKFCSILRLRLKGDEASFLAMTTFRESLQADVKDWMLADLEKRKGTANRITVIMVTGILAIVMIVYFATFMGMAF